MEILTVQQWLFLGPLPQSVLCYDATWFALSADANLVRTGFAGVWANRSSQVSVMPARSFPRR